MITDFYGKPLTIGTGVAFNYQGSVRIGVITKIKPNKDRMGRKYPKEYGTIFFVNHIWRQGVSPETKVRNLAGIVSLADIDWP